MKTFVISDTHFGHRNIINFEDKNGNKIRPFSSIEEHDETIIQNCNKLVKPQDRLYVLGDVAMGRRHVSTVNKLNGRKVLIKGNHDIFKLKDYAPFFDDIRACRVYPKHRIILSHIPIHSIQMERWSLNVHGHMHQNIIDDSKYLNVCLENTKFFPVDMELIIHINERLGELNE